MAITRYSNVSHLSRDRKSGIRTHLPIDPFEFGDRAAGEHFYRHPEDLEDYKSDIDREARNRRLAYSFLSLIPFVGPFMSGIMNSITDQAAQDKFNHLEAAQAYAANLYNLPKNQVARMRAAGVNPYLSMNNIENVPYQRPDFGAYRPSDFGSFDLSGVSSLIRTFMESEKLPYQLEGMDITNKTAAYNLEYILQEQYLQMQNKTALQNLEVAWNNANFEEVENIKKEMLKLNDLQLQRDYVNNYLLQSFQGNQQVFAIHDDGSVTLRYDDGTIVDALNVPLKDMPQNFKITYNNFLKGLDLSNAQIKQALATASNQSVMASLNQLNANRVDLFLDTYNKYHVWPDEPFGLRNAAGMVPNGGMIWLQNFGQDASSDALQMLLNLGTAAGMKGLGSRSFYNY